MFNNILETIGNTPMIKCEAIEDYYQLKGSIFAKVEAFNPSGSIKDRAAKNMIEIDTCECDGISEGCSSPLCPSQYDLKYNKITTNTCECNNIDMACSNPLCSSQYDLKLDV